MESVHDIVRRAEQNYLQGEVKLGKYVTWSMHDTIETIDAYLNSKHVSGSEDSLGRPKPFFNIVTAAVNIWYRATDIDRKDIRFIPQRASSVVLAFLANVLLQRWMDENNFGAFLNQWGRALSRYGSAVVKFVEKQGELSATVIPWNRIVPDAIDFDALPRIEKFYKTPGQLRAMATKGHPDYAGYDGASVTALIEAVQNRRTLDKQQQDNQPGFIEVYEVHGLLDSRLLQKEPDEKIEDKDIVYTQQMHAISYVKSGTGEAEYQDFCLYKGKERIDPNMITHLIEEDGRTLSIGAVEYLFDAQWMTNHSVKNMKDTLDLASKLIFQTADANFVGRNVLNAIETGDILIHQQNMGLERIANDKPDVSALHSFATFWQQMGKEVTGTPDALRGVSGGGGVTAYRAQALMSKEANTLFEIMTENKGLAIEKMLRTYVIPHLKKQLQHTDEIAAILDESGIKEIDSIYVPKEAIKRFNKRSTEQLFKAVEDPNAPLPTPFDPQTEQAGVQQELSSAGNKRFFKPDEIGKKQWADIFSDFEWDAIKVEVTNENVDKQAIMQTLSTVLQTVASNPAILQDPNAKMLFGKILTETGVASPLEISTTAAQPQPPNPAAQPAPMGPVPSPAGGGITR